MQIEENKSVVLINIPRFCVPRACANEFIQMSQKFWSDVKVEMLEQFGAKRLEYDTVYKDGDFIPMVEETNSYTDVCHQSIVVDQIDKYVSVQKGEKFTRDDIEKLWDAKEDENE